MVFNGKTISNIKLNNDLSSFYIVRVLGNYSLCATEHPESLLLLT